MRFKTSILLVLMAGFNMAQSPGGISTSLRGWFDASTGLSLSGSAVTQWNDRSGNNFHATQTTSGNRPANTGLINYNTAMVFDGANDFLNIPDLVPSAATGLSVFGLARQTGTGNDTWGCVILGQTNSSSWVNGGYGLTALVSGNTSFGFWVRDWNVNFVSYATVLSAPTLMSGNWNGTSANNVQYFQNGSSIGTDPYAPGSVGDNGNSYIGSGVGTGSEYCFYGQIAELAVYNTGLSSANVNRVETYFALKYGITLPTNYVNSAGTTIFTTATPYNNNIIGIGRDDGSGLVQKQSQNFDDSVRVFIGSLAASNSANAATFSSNHSYIVMGADAGRIRARTNEKPSGIFSRIDREWKVTNTGYTGTFGFALKLSAGASPGSVNTSHLRLLVDDDGDFSNATEYSGSSGLTFAYSNPVITVTGINNTMIPAGSTRFITLASNVSSTPLPIELIEFKADHCDTGVCINWRTASEYNSSHFEIERSFDAVNWNPRGTIPAWGNSSQIREYNFLDREVPSGNAYYSLRQFDLDQVSKRSSVVYMQAQKPVTRPLALIPNPADNSVSFLYDCDVAGIRVFDLSGNDYTSVCGLSVNDGGRVIIGTQTLAEGVYLVYAPCSHEERKYSKLLIKH